MEQNREQKSKTIVAWPWAEVRVLHMRINATLAQAYQLRLVLGIWGWDFGGSPGLCLERMHPHGKPCVLVSPVPAAARPPARAGARSGRSALPLAPAGAVSAPQQGSVMWASAI